MNQKRVTNKDRIIDASLELFNQSGAVAITTNHIAAHLGISPGNLYFHFKDKREIVRVLFQRMCGETYAVWKDQEQEHVLRKPRELIELVFSVFYKYRFFHREMYHLRRIDPELSNLWKKHLVKTQRLMLRTYTQWVRQGWMKSVRDKREMQFISDTLFITSSSFLNFFESSQKPARDRSVRMGMDYVQKFLEPYQL